MRGKEKEIRIKVREKGKETRIKVRERRKGDKDISERKKERG